MEQMARARKAPVSHRGRTARACISARILCGVRLRPTGFGGTASATHSRNAIKACFSARILCGAGYAVVSFVPRKNERGDGAPKGASVLSCRAPDRSAGASRRSTCGVRSAPGRASEADSWRAADVSGPAEPHPISELLAAGRSARGRGPGAARVRGFAKARARAPRNRGRFPGSVRRGLIWRVSPRPPSPLLHLRIASRSAPHEQTIGI